MNKDPRIICSVNTGFGWACAQTNKVYYQINRDFVSYRNPVSSGGILVFALGGSGKDAKPSAAGIMRTQRST
jgi:uncharacterized protein YraI